MPQPAPASSATQVQQLVEAQAATRARFAAQATAAALLATRQFTRWYSTDDITTWAAKVTLMVEAYQRALAASTDSYLARVIALLTGRVARPIGRIDVSGLRQGITHAGAYGRGANVYRYQQAIFDDVALQIGREAESVLEPPQIVSPIDAAMQRVTDVVDLDMQLAAREQSRQVMQSHGDVLGYRRVLHPELSRGVCGLCVAASHRLYKREELMPIHDNCKCETLPVLEGRDPGSLINGDDLGKLYKLAGGTTSGPALKQVRYMVNDHGELGPILSPEGQPIRDRGTPAKPDVQPLSDVERAAAVQQRVDDLTAALPRIEQLADSAASWKPFITAVEDRIDFLMGELANH